MQASRIDNWRLLYIARTVKYWSDFVKKEKLITLTIPISKLNCLTVFRIKCGFNFEEKKIEIQFRKKKVKICPREE